MSVKTKEGTTTTRQAVTNGFTPHPRALFKPGPIKVAFSGPPFGRVSTLVGVYIICVEMTLFLL